MNGVLHIDGAKVEATTGHMLVTFESGGDAFRFHLPAHVALHFRQMVMRDAWQVCCAPDAEVVNFEAGRKPNRPK
mgnify:CR=1 FL=1